MKFDFAFVFFFGLSLSAKEAFGQSCAGNSKCNSNGCSYGSVAGNGKLVSNGANRAIDNGCLSLQVYTNIKSHRSIFSLDRYKLQRSVHLHESFWEWRN